MGKYVIGDDGIVRYTDDDQAAWTPPPGGPAPLPDGTDVGNVPVVSADDGESAPAEVTVSAPQPVYLRDGDEHLAQSFPEAQRWRRAPYDTEDGRPLYFHSGDLPGGYPTADGSGGIWHAYDGKVVIASVV